MSLGARREVVLSRWEVPGDQAASRVLPLHVRQKNTSVKRRPFLWHRSAVSGEVHLGFSYSAIFCVGDVVGPGFRSVWQGEGRRNRKIPGFQNHAGT